MDDKTQPTFSGGDLIAGKYRVERVLGSGGMGVVLAAHHEGLNTPVAIKLLRTAALGHTDVVGRFTREARAAVSLRSQHVARVFDVGTLDNGLPYIVMERLDGQDLGEVCEAATRPAIADCIEYMLQACEAIAEAHAAGIIHRDLKPKNLFLARSVTGKPLIKVLDFGISKIENMAPGEMQLTKTTEIIGSPSYMSPEQLRSSRNVDARTDIWALGVILYELLTGRVPFNAETVTELVLVVVTEPQPPVRSLRPDVPPGLEAVVDRCLQKNPDARYQSVVELVQALEPFAASTWTTVTERVRAVSSNRAGLGATAPLASVPPGMHAGPPSSGPVLPLVAASSSGSIHAPKSSGRINVHGGTSVAWGETQSAVQPRPSLPAPMQRGLVTRSPAFVIAAAVIAVGIALSAVGMMILGRPPAKADPPTVAAAGSEMPLPPGRKDLPPATTPSPSASAEVPVPSALPEDRKPGAIPPPKPVAAQPKPAAPQPKPPQPKSNELDGVGRR